MFNRRSINTRMNTEIQLNKNAELVEKIRQRIKDNDGYCPCALIKNEDTKCMCKEFRELIKEGSCHCGLYYKIKMEEEHNG